MKKCKVVSYNPYRGVLVFSYDNKTIQTHYHLDCVPEFVYVSCSNGKYEISLKNKRSKQIKNNKSSLTKLETELVDENYVNSNILLDSK